MPQTPKEIRIDEFIGILPYEAVCIRRWKFSREIIIKVYNYEQKNRTTL
jgi:hypothetical protein